MPVQKICDCPYTYGKGKCVKETILIPGTTSCADCPFNKDCLPILFVNKIHKTY